jgi:hypothetical protein
MDTLNISDEVQTDTKEIVAIGSWLFQVYYFNIYIFA